MSVKTKGFESGHEQLVPVDTTATLEAKQTLGWDSVNGKYKATPTIVTITTTLASSDNVTLPTADFPIEFGSPKIVSLSTGIAHLATNYTTKVITISSHKATAQIKVTYGKFAYEPSAMLSEGVAASQSPAYAKALVHGVVNDASLYKKLTEDTKARLASNGIVVLEREEVIG